MRYRSFRMVLFWGSAFLDWIEEVCICIQGEDFLCRWFTDQTDCILRQRNECYGQNQLSTHGYFLDYDSRQTRRSTCSPFRKYRACTGKRVRRNNRATEKIAIRFNNTTPSLFALFYTRVCKQKWCPFDFPFAFRILIIVYAVNMNCYCYYYSCYYHYYEYY